MRWVVAFLGSALLIVGAIMGLQAILQPDSKAAFDVIERNREAASKLPCANYAEGHQFVDWGPPPCEVVHRTDEKIAEEISGDPVEPNDDSDIQFREYVAPELPNPKPIQLLNPSIVFDADICVPIEPAIPEYPLVRKPIEADCNSEFFIDEEGRPFDITVECTEPVFVRATERAIAKMRWRIRDHAGRVCYYVNHKDASMRYPISYRLE